MSLSSMPLEVIILIAKWLDKKSLASLAVCNSQLRAFVTPVLYSSIKIGYPWQFPYKSENTTPSRALDEEYAKAKLVQHNRMVWLPQ